VLPPIPGRPDPRTYGWYDPYGYYAYEPTYEEYYPEGWYADPYYGYGDWAEDWSGCGCDPYQDYEYGDWAGEDWSDFDPWYE
jgi:hypothetical protein